MEAAGKGSKMAQQREAKNYSSTGDNPEDCPVCLTMFDDTTQRPRTLPCGHTVCTLCTNKLKELDHVTCPECRISHSVPEGGQFPVSYVIEALIRRMRDTEVAAVAPLPPSVGKGKGAVRAAGQKEVAGLSKKMHSFLQEQEARLLATITTCQELQSQLDEYRRTITFWDEQQQQLQERLQGLLDQSKSARKLMLQENFRAVAKKEKVKKEEQQLHVALEMLRTITAEQEAGGAIAEVVRCTGEAEQVMEECQENFPDGDTVSTFIKIRESFNAALEAFQPLQVTLEAHPSLTKELRSQSDPESTIMDRLEAIVGLPTLKVEDLRSLTQPARCLLKAGRVFAVHQVKGEGLRHARISLEGDQLYLHTLKKHPLPGGAQTVQVSQVVPPSPPCTVFLDLSWPGVTPRRVKVHLCHNTPHGRQFVLLCTGQRGNSYANTRMFRVENKGEEGDCVCGGDYERNDGTGGAPLLPDLGKGEYRVSGRAGDVCGRWGLCDPARGAQFGIITRDCEDGGVYYGVFGKVVSGIEAVVAAAQHTDIKEVTVVDCGLVL